MISLFFRNLFFTILQPGLVAGLFPYLLDSDQIRLHLDVSFGTGQYAGLILFIVGWCLILYCIYRFAVEGQGTLSPVDQTKNLVKKGIYRYSRNPMYIGVIIALIGMALFAYSSILLGYSILIFTMFNFWVIYVEEPRLRRDFGAQYMDYSKSVRRWL
ncbi:MAG: isoprenylcysteine carboxylmethyltransferase family protein [Saprospiraceae bacterium]